MKNIINDAISKNIKLQEYIKHYKTNDIFIKR